MYRGVPFFFPPRPRLVRILAIVRGDDLQRTRRRVSFENRAIVSMTQPP